MSNMKKKKGFMFIETIVTLTFLATVLLMLYSTFTNLLGNEKRVTDYEKKGYRYSLFYIKEWMIDNNIDLSADRIFNDENDNFKILASYIEKESVGPKDYNDAKINSEPKKSKFKSLANTYNLKTLVILRCKNVDNENLFLDWEESLLTNEFMQYIKSLGTCKEYNQKYKTYRIIGEFYDEENKQDYQAFIYYPNLEGGY